jgi:hypothetical protein
MKIFNTTKGDLGLTPELIVPAGGSIDVTEEQADAFAGSAVVRAWVDEGKLVAEGDMPESDAEEPTEPDDADVDDADETEITREAIAEMDKDGLIEVLETHGVDVDKRTGEEKLREMAIQTIFIEV